MTGLETGTLDRRITIMRATESDDGLATVLGEAKPIGKRWARKTDVKDGERVQAAEQGQSITTRFLVRHDAVTKTITGKDTIVCEGRAYEVVGTKEYGGTRIGIEITVTSRPDVAP